MNISRRSPLAVRHWVVLFLGLLGGSVLMIPNAADHRALAVAQPVHPNITPGSSHQGISFRDRLIVGLQARRGTEVDFIDAVVLKVRLGKLPERLVNQTFFWSRDRAARPGHTITAATQRPIIYFQPVMAAQAKKLGVTL
jgi:hypothetical protein